MTLVRRRTSPEAVDALAAAIVDPARDQPIVAVTSLAGDTSPAFDVEVIRRIVGDKVDLVSIVNGPLTRRLSESLPQMELGVYGGAARIWWPGVRVDSDPHDHPLVQDKYRVHGTKAEGWFETEWRKGAPAKAPAVDDPKHLLLQRRLDSVNTGSVVTASSIWLRSAATSTSTSPSPSGCGVPP